MLTTLGSAFGAKLAERWAPATLTPAAIFWLGGLAAYVYANGGVDGWRALVGHFTSLNTAEQILLAVAAVLLVVLSTAVVQSLGLPVLRVLEGFWPHWLAPVRRLLIAWHNRRAARNERRWQELAGMITGSPPIPLYEYLRLDQRLRRYPPAPHRRMPTRLGNNIRAAEGLPWDKYGLNTVTCWPRLWLVLPDAVKAELTEARLRVDAVVAAWVWAIGLLVWTPWAWWAAPIGLVGSVLAYVRLISVAAVYGDLVESAFDLHRVALYHALRWPLPTSPAHEREAGYALTQYLWRGSDSDAPTFEPSP